MKKTSDSTLETIRILLVDDHEMVRMGLRSLLSSHEDFEVVGETATVAGAIRAIEEIKPDIVLLDIRLKDGKGFEVCRQLKESRTDTSRILILTSYSSDDLVLEAIESGADGFLMKDVDSDSLISAIRKVAGGESALDASSTRLLMNRLKQDAQGGYDPGQLELLSDQEMKVLERVAEGKTNKEIGVGMGLSDKTVKNYLANLMGKLGISRRAEAAAIYTRWKQKGLSDF